MYDILGVQAVSRAHQPRRQTGERDADQEDPQARNVALPGQRHQFLAAQLHNSIVTSDKDGLALERRGQIRTPMIIGGLEF